MKLPKLFAQLEYDLTVCLRMRYDIALGYYVNQVAKRPSPWAFCCKPRLRKSYKYSFR